MPASSSTTCFSGRLSEDGIWFYVGVFLLLLAVAAFFAAMHWHVSPRRLSSRDVHLGPRKGTSILPSASLLFFFLLVGLSSAFVSAIHYSVANQTTCACEFATLKVHAENLQGELAHEDLTLISTLDVQPGFSKSDCSPPRRRSIRSTSTPRATWRPASIRCALNRPESRRRCASRTVRVSNSKSLRSNPPARTSTSCTPSPSATTPTCRATSRCRLT